MTPGHARRHRPSRIAIIVVAVAVALGALGALSYAVLHSRYFAASIVRVSGARHETAAGVERVAGLATSPPMISIDQGTIASRIEAAYPWVATVTVTEHWPHTVDVRLTERTAVAIVREPTGMRLLVDRTGRLLGPPAPGQILPLVLYAVPGTSAAIVAVPATELSGLYVAATLPRAFKAQVAVIRVAASGTVSLHLTTPLTFLLGPPSDLAEKYEDIASVIDHATVHIGDVVDVSVPQAITVTGP